MAKTRQTYPLMVVQLAVFISLATSVTSAVCKPGAANLNVIFPETDVTPIGAQYTQLLVPSDVNNFTIQLTGVSMNLPANDYFRIQYNSSARGYYISMIKGIDRDGKTPDVRDDTNTLQYQVTCTNHSTNSSVPHLYTIVKIQITDVNDNSPVFTSPKYTTSISELTSTGIVIYQISSTDLDNGLNGQVQYSLSNSPGAMFNGSKYFTITPNGQGNVSVKAYLDFESMYKTAIYQPSRVFFNITVTARDSGSRVRSNSTILIITILDADDQDPGFVYPSCLTCSEELKLQSCVRPKYRASISSDTAQVISLQMTPDPADAKSPDTAVNIIMQDQDTLNSPVSCSVSNTIPAGYEQLFQTNSTQFGQTKQYKCDVLYVPDVNTSLGSLGLAQMELVIKAQETSYYKRLQYASVIVTITGSSASYCPAGYNIRSTNLGVIICTGTEDKDTSTALGLGIALGFTILIIIILIIVSVVLLRRQKPAPNKTVQNYSHVDMTQREGHNYDGIYVNELGGTTGYQGVSSGQSDKQIDSSCQSHIYDDLIDESIIRRERSPPENGGYANITAQV